MFKHISSYSRELTIDERKIKNPDHRFWESKIHKSNKKIRMYLRLELSDLCLVRKKRRRMTFSVSI